MRYVSLFSGVEAASVAWGPLGWQPMAFSEIEPFPCEVLKEHYPEVPNLGDVTKIDWSEFIEYNGRPDLLVGGSPCQSFSMAGSRDTSKASPDSCSSTYAQLMSYARAGLSGKTCLGLCLPKGLKARGGALSSACSESWRNSGMAFAGVFLTLSTSEWPSDADVCFLSDVLETSDVPQRYFLSPTACQGILRRAASRGKELPSPLKETLERVVANAALSDGACEHDGCD